MFARLCYILLIFALLLFFACDSDNVKRGDIALRIGDYERAIANFTIALDKEPANRNARYGLALSYYAIAENAEHLKIASFDLWNKAANEFKILSKIDRSKNIGASYSTCLFYLARATIAQNNAANVLPILNKSIMLDSTNYFSYNLKALILSEQYSENESAKELFIYIITHEPKFVSAYVNLGNIYWNEGDIESAWDTWSAGKSIDPQNNLLIHWTQVAEDSLKSLVLLDKL